MRINNIEFNAELGDILTELVAQLRANNIPYLQKIKETSKTFQVTCPFHANGMERRPSAGIRKSDGKFHCFACGEIKELQEVISYCFGHEDVLGTFGWNWLLKNFLTIEVEERKDVELDFSRSYKLPKGGSLSNKSRFLDGNTDFELVGVSEEELDKYRFFHPYMYKRKLTDEIIELFDIGYDKETDCITFPVRDENGKCLFVARRSVKSKFFNYPKDAEKTLYGVYEFKRIESEISKAVMFMRMPFTALSSLEELVICESMLDALTCWVYGKYAIALNGTGSYEQYKQLERLPCRKFILATDKDEAGRKAREKIRKNVKGKIITEYDFSSYPKRAKDINDMSKEEFDALVEVF